MKADNPESKQSFPGDNRYRRLQVIDRLEVGPIKIEPRRLSAPYTIINGKTRDSIELVYSYEEDIFTGNDQAEMNLASMILAQVAFNYGIFCKVIAFNGVFSSIDRKFIADMTENTSREIYVKKLLEPNPYMGKDWSGLTAEKRKTYTQATLEFPDTDLDKKKLPWSLWSANDKRYTVLSSGGKDSLLSFGLLNELGCETHPIYVNESGRHWFTAMNAYKYFKDNIPNTARVWVNSDRVFAWFLRHLPFIRPDFVNVRADEYAIRLWTVAVFLFGALPLMKKRGIGRLVIGDEYDTTEKATSSGIPHFSGLFDQSRYFDEILSRYFLRKGWSIMQFSILRPMSELLIEKTLVERYPHLFEHQVSCHATHKEGERSYPCGKCEKCRRIVGMLKAFDGDPHKCGYNDKQIADCLEALTKKDLHQESAGAEHLRYLLTQKGTIILNPEDKIKVKANPEVMKLRFDQKRSPANNIPRALRSPLYKIMLQHADGSVKLSNKAWRDFDLLSDAEVMSLPYPFELKSESLSRAVSSDSAELPAKILWAELTWPEAEERLKETDIALLPVGAIEQHGPHLTLDVDSFDADYLAQQVAGACSEPKPLVLPPIAYGVSYHHDEFKGTISIGNETLAELIYEIGTSVAKNGIKKLVIINGHGGNAPALNYAAQLINRDTGIFACVDTGETSDYDLSALIETPNDVHAGEYETSTSLAIRPHLVRMDLAQKQVPKFSNRYLNFTSSRGVPWYARTKKISASGIMGDPTKASAEKGRKMWEIMIAHLTAFVEDLKSMTLDEIFQKRY
jgi:creatinine amidohydrolase/Fe(II)-dependent formamide hydrolase-like protein